MKERIVLLLLICSLLFVQIVDIKQVIGQSIVAPAIDWQSTYGGFKVEQTSNKEYIIFGLKRLTKLDYLGELEWTQTYSIEFYSGDQCSDGGYVLAGGTSLVKTDETGVIQWEHNYEENGFLIRLVAVKQTSDGCYCAIYTQTTIRAIEVVF